MILTYFCKKGGVGKTTVCGEHADYLRSKGKKVLLISIDDQNSIFEMFGKVNTVFDRDDNFLEHALTGSAKLEDILIPLRDNLDGIKTLNTDMISKKLTIERPFEKVFVNFLKKCEEKYDDVFIDLPPSNCRASEVIFDLCTHIISVVQLNKLGVNGLYNTLQYFTDCGIDLSKIEYILPNGYSKNKSVPSVSLDEIKAIAKENVPACKVLEPLPTKTCIEALQQRGVTIFDDKEYTKQLSPYHKQQKKLLMEIFEKMFKKIKL